MGADGVHGVLCRESALDMRTGLIGEWCRILTGATCEKPAAG
jgi:hypothetical protein